MLRYSKRNYDFKDIQTEAKEKIDNTKKFKIQGRHSTSVSFPLEIKGIFYVFSMQSFALEARAKIENALISI